MAPICGADTENYSGLQANILVLNDMLIKK